MTYKRYEYWTSKGKVWTPWFEWRNPDFKPEFQLMDRRIMSRLYNEYKEI